MVVSLFGGHGSSILDIFEFGSILDVKIIITSTYQQLLHQFTN